MGGGRIWRKGKGQGGGGGKKGGARKERSRGEEVTQLMLHFKYISYQWFIDNTAHHFLTASHVSGKVLETLHHNYTHVYMDIYHRCGL